jgi:hypothetical protein
LRILFVAKTPTPDSVNVGHYFQGRPGANFWNRLKQYGLLTPTTTFEDDSLHAQGVLADRHRQSATSLFGRAFRERIPRGPRILELIHLHHPRVLAFIDKSALDKMANLHFSGNELFSNHSVKMVYGRSQRGASKN